MVNKSLLRWALATVGVMAMATPVLAQARLPLRLAAPADTATNPALGADDTTTNGTDPLADPLTDSTVDVQAALPPQPALQPQPQEVPRRISRPKADPFAPLGGRAGAFIVKPSLEMGGVFSTNPLQAPDTSKAGGGLRLRPAVAFQSDWIRHSWSGEASGEFIRYLNGGSSKDITASAATDLRLDMRRTTRADFNAHYALSQTEAGSGEVESNAVDPRRDHTLGASAGITQTFGPMDASAKLAVERNFYSDVKLASGLTEDNGDRAYTEPALSVRAAFNGGAFLSPFVEAGYAPRFHDEKRDRNGLKRNSHGFTLRAGLGFDDGALWNGEVAAKYETRNYADPALKTLQVVGLDGTVTWRPTEITTVLATLGTALNESATATSSGSKVWTGNLALTQAVRENLDLKFNAGAEFENGEGGTDITATAGGSLEYKFSPLLAADAGYTYTRFHGALPGTDWDEHRVLASLIWHY